MADYLVSSTHPEDLASGRVVEPGEIVEVDVKDSHNRRLVDDGRLILIPAKRKRKAQGGTTT